MIRQKCQFWLGSQKLDQSDYSIDQTLRNKNCENEKIDSFYYPRNTKNIEKRVTFFVASRKKLDFTVFLRFSLKRTSKGIKMSKSKKNHQKAYFRPRFFAINYQYIDIFLQSQKPGNFDISVKFLDCFLWIVYGLAFFTTPTIFLKLQSSLSAFYWTIGIFCMMHPVVVQPRKKYLTSFA